MIGAGLGRTGRFSLKVALERLLGGSCYHMIDVFSHPAHIPAWHDAIRGRIPDWEPLLGEWRASVDEPPAALWRELHEAYPDALVLLSVRDAADWWESVDATVFILLREGPPPAPPAPPIMADWHAMVVDMFERACCRVARACRPGMNA